MNRKKYQYPPRTRNLETLMHTYCASKNLALYQFLDINKINPKTWYSILLGKVPLFSVVTKIVHGTDGYISYQHFREALEEKCLNIDRERLKDIDDK